jgi:DNA-binding MarR family transcriptional regulator
VEPLDWIDGLSDAWGREYPNLDVSTFPPLVRLARLGILIETLQCEVVEPFELTPSDYSVLAALRRAGAPYALSPSYLYSRLERSSGGMTKILKRLEDRGLVSRAPDPEDGRGSLMTLTEEGLELQERVFNAFLSSTQDVLASASKTRLGEIDRSLKFLLEAFEGYFYR